MYAILSMHHPRYAESKVEMAAALSTVSTVVVGATVGAAAETSCWRLMTDEK